MQVQQDAADGVQGDCLERRRGRDRGQPQVKNIQQQKIYHFEKFSHNVERVAKKPNCFRDSF